MKYCSLLPFAVLLPMLARANAAAADPWSWADRPFDGTWVIQPELTTFGMRSPTFSLERGVFRRSDCRGEPIDVPADGAAHGVKGQPYFDAVSVRVIGARRVEIADKKKDQLVWKGLYTVAADGRSLRLEFEDDRALKPVTGVMAYVREGDAPVGAHALSGTWRADKLTRLSSSGLAVSMTMQRKQTDDDEASAPPSFDDGYTLAASDGRSAAGKLDAHDAPLNGYLPGATVALSRLQPAVLQFNRAQDGTLVEIDRAAVSRDGETMTLSQIDWLCQAKTVYTLTKQAP